MADAQAVFGGGGNSFRLLRTLTTLGVLEPLRQAAQAGVPYLAASAGGNLAGPAIRTTNDMPIVEPGSLAALGLIPFQLNPTTSTPARAVPTRGRPARQGSRSSRRKRRPRPGPARRRLAAGLWHPGTPVGPQHRPPVPPAYRPLDIPVGADLSDLLNTRPRFDVGTTA